MAVLSNLSWITTRTIKRLMYLRINGNRWNFRLYLSRLIQAAIIILMMQAPALAEPPYPPPDAVIHGFEVVHVYPHDPKAFTQGLIYRNGFLLESTGINGRSTLRVVRLETGEGMRTH